MSACNCGTKSFLHLVDCNTIAVKMKQPLAFLLKESNESPGSIIFYVTPTEEDSVNQLKTFRNSLKQEDWLYTVSAGAVGTLTMNNTTEITFLPEDQAFILMELPNSSCIYFEITDKNKELAENLMSKTEKLIFINPTTKELA